MVYIHRMADVLMLRVQDKRGALAISPTVVNTKANMGSSIAA